MNGVDVSSDCPSGRGFGDSCISFHLSSIKANDDTPEPKEWCGVNVQSIL